MDMSQDMEDTPVEEFEGIGMSVNQSFLNSFYYRVGQYYDIIDHHDIMIIKIKLRDVVNAIRFISQKHISRILKCYLSALKG